MSRKKHDRDTLDIDDPGHPDFAIAEANAEANVVAEGAEVAVPDHAPPVATTRHTVNELMYDWWKEVRQITPSPEAIGDHFAAFAAAEGYQLTEIEPPPPEEPAPE